MSVKGIAVYVVNSYCKQSLLTTVGHLLGCAETSTAIALVPQVEKV